MTCGHASVVGYIQYCHSRAPSSRIRSSSGRRRHACKVIGREFAISRCNRARTCEAVSVPRMIASTSLLNTSAAAIEVGRPDRYPHAIDSRDLGMQYRVLHFVDACARFEQVAVGGPTGIDRILHIGVRGHHQAKVDTASRRPGKVLTLLMRRDEIAARQPDAALGGADRRFERQVIERTLVARHAADDANRLHTLPRKRREIAGRLNRVALRATLSAERREHTGWRTRYPAGCRNFGARRSACASAWACSCHW